MERSKSFLHPPDPVKRQQSVSNLAHRSHSIADVLKAVEAGRGGAVGPDAYLPNAYRSPPRGGGAAKQPVRSQEELFRASSFVRDTSSFDAELAAAERQRELDRKVVLFPTELRGHNRFFGSPELGQKAAALVQDSRRPSSLFSNGLSSSCREELNTIHRVKKYEQIKETYFAAAGRAEVGGGGGVGGSRTVSPTRGTTTASPTAARSASVFRPMELDDEDPFPTPLLGLPRNAGRLRLGPRATSPEPWPAMTTTNEPQFLTHVEEEDREGLDERDKFGRRVEYGRMVGMFREEILASRVNRHQKSAKKHAEVAPRDANNHEVVLDWMHCDITDAVELMDVLPRGGVMLLERSGGTEVRKTLRNDSHITTTGRSSATQPHAGGGGVGRGATSRGASAHTATSCASHPNDRRLTTPSDGARRRASTPGGTSSGDTVARHSSATPGGVASVSRSGTPNESHRGRRTKRHEGSVEIEGAPRPHHSHHQKPPMGRSGTSNDAKKKTVTVTGKSPRRGTAAPIKLGAGAQQRPPQPVDGKRRGTTIAVGSDATLPPALLPSGPVRKSQVWKLKYCFSDDDADGIIDVQRGMVVVETGGTKYAFDPSKAHVSRDLEAEQGTFMSAAKRERLRWLRMTPAEREARRIHNLLGCGKAYEGRHVNLSNNGLRRVDVMLTNTLAVILRFNVTKLDLSFNRIETIDWDFLHVDVHAVEERKRVTMMEAEAHEEEYMRNEAFTHSGLLSDTQTQKQRETFLHLRRRAIQDLVETTAPHKLFYHLQSLYLHGNPLRDISEIWKLEPLRLSLAYLTFHGQHHVDVQAKEPKHRVKLLNMFPKLVQLNFTTLLPSDEDASYTATPGPTSS